MNKPIRQKKVYKIILGTTDFNSDDRKKPLRNVDNFDVYEARVIATSAVEALEYADNWISEKEKDALSEFEGVKSEVFVQEIVHLTDITDLEN